MKNSFSMRRKRYLLLGITLTLLASTIVLLQSQERAYEDVSKRANDKQLIINHCGGITEELAGIKEHLILREIETTLGREGLRPLSTDLYGNTFNLDVSLYIIRTHLTEIIRLKEKTDVFDTLREKVERQFNYLFTGYPVTEAIENNALVDLQRRLQGFALSIEQVERLHRLQYKGLMARLDVKSRRDTQILFGFVAVLVVLSFFSFRWITGLIIIEIEKQKKAAEELRQSEVRNQALINAVPDLIFRYRSDGTFLDYKADEERLMMPAEELVGSNIFDLPMPTDVVEDIMMLTAQAIETGEHQTLEYALTMSGGKKVFEARIVTSGLNEVIAIVRDITEHKQAEVKQGQLIKELEARNAELERFTYTVSHDLKSPLVTIKGFLGLLVQDVQAGNEEALKVDVEHISNAADKMVRLLNELLELSRIGRLMDPPEDVDLTALAGEAASLVAGQIAARGVTVEIDPEMPSVYGDPVRLSEVYQNLIENAVKFMGEQTAPRVEISTRRNGAEVECFVRDNGMGIAPTYHEKIFGLFERLDQRIEGTGIGLALVRRIVEVHGGRIWVESEGEGYGSTFYFTLPSYSSQVVQQGS